MRIICACDPYGSALHTKLVQHLGSKPGVEVRSAEGLPAAVALLPPLVAAHYDLPMLPVSLLPAAPRCRSLPAQLCGLLALSSC